MECAPEQIRYGDYCILHKFDFSEISLREALVDYSTKQAKRLDKLKDSVLREQALRDIEQLSHLFREVPKIGEGKVGLISFKRR
jgi:hypothetical protein